MSRTPRWRALADLEARAPEEAEALAARRPEDREALGRMRAWAELAREASAAAPDIDWARVEAGLADALPRAAALDALSAEAASAAPDVDWARVEDGLAEALRSGRTPKWKALVAYHEGALSPEGRRRVEALLARSPLDREALAKIRALDAASDELGEAEAAPVVDFEKMKSRLAREARRQTRPASRPWLLGAVVAAAAALAFLWLKG
ncbi:MAG TPA: hypothetical protein RMH80_30820, partial [Polyangiaceae bacterium LLY-WYZ-15_(1-7)]|nr:hypothetical protein [Polyangiaceae bacterium LLY-WYZ-15_(1-7)]